MQYKLCECDRGFYQDIPVLPLLPDLQPSYVRVTEKAPAQKRKYRQLAKYDIAVANNHNYFVGGAGKGVLVHNSPETEPGGQAVKYYPDYKLRMRKRKVEDDKVGLKVLPFSVYSLKNKTYPPFQQANGSIVLGRGLDKAQDAHEFLDAIGRLEVKNKGGRRILLKRFDQGFMSWRDFRGVTETQDFRDYCFHLLTLDRTYQEYFKKQGFSNYNYDDPAAQSIAPPEVHEEPDQETQDDDASQD